MSKLYSILDPIRSKAKLMITIIDALVEIHQSNGNLSVGQQTELLIISKQMAEMIHEIIEIADHNLKGKL